MARTPERQQPSDDDALRQKAKELARIFKASTSTDRGVVERPKFLERWMASYLAELLEREKKAARKLRTFVRSEMAAVIPALWELQLARDALRIRTQVDWWERRVQEIDDKSATLLRPLLEKPENVIDVPLESSDAVLGWLAHAESLFRRYLFALSEALKAAATTAQGRENEVVVVFGKRDEQMADLSKVVLKLLPGLVSVDPSDIATNRRILGGAMANAIKARFALATILAESPQSDRGAGASSTAKSKVRSQSTTKAAPKTQRPRLRGKSPRG